MVEPQEKKKYPVSKEKQAEYNQRYIKKHKAVILRRGAEWREKNKDYCREYGARYRAENPEKIKETKKKSYLKTRHKWAAYLAQRRALMNLATPAWANEFIVSEIYELSELRKKCTGINWHVDHIVPLNSEIVCGLHCEQNLRVIPATENVRKSNKYWPEMP